MTHDTAYMTTLASSSDQDLRHLQSQVVGCVSGLNSHIPSLEVNQWESQNKAQEENVTLREQQTSIVATPSTVLPAPPQTWQCVSDTGSITNLAQGG